MAGRKDEQYKLVIKQAESLLQGEHDLIANMSNLVSLIFHTIPGLNGATCYRFVKGELILGPFQGKPACMHIAVGKGVCGKVAETKHPEIVPDVKKFSGHIACDDASKSEIVIPVFQDSRFWGVLDLDSPDFNHFDQTDRLYLDKIAPLIF